MVMPRTTRRYVNYLSFVLAFLVIFSTEARADLFGFAPLSNNSGVSSDIANQLSVDVTDYGVSQGGVAQVLFTFHNAGPLDSTIGRVYFDDGELLGIAEIIEAPPDVDFVSPVSGGENFPGGETLTPPFETTVGFSAGVKGNIAQGVDPGESLGIVFDLENNYYFADVIDWIHLGLENPAPTDSLRIGLHVQRLGVDDEFSDGFMHTPTPGAMILGSIGIGMVITRLKRKTLIES